MKRVTLVVALLLSASQAWGQAVAPVGGGNLNTATGSFPNSTAVPIYDSNSSHSVTLGTSENTSANYRIDFNPTSGNRTVTMTGNATIGTNTSTWTGITPASGVSTFLAAPSSANALAMFTGETGTGNPVFSASPTLTGTALAANATLSGLLTFDSGGQTSAVVQRFETNETLAADFSTAIHTATNPNGGETRRDQQMIWGYNVSATGAKQLAGEHSFYQKLENYWDTGAFDQLEYYYEYVSPDGLTTVRPFSITPTLGTSAIRIDHNAGSVYFGDPTEALKWLLVSSTSTTGLLSLSGNSTIEYGGTAAGWLTRGGFETIGYASSKPQFAGDYANAGFFRATNASSATMTMQFGAQSNYGIFQWTGAASGPLKRWEFNVLDGLQNWRSEPMALPSQKKYQVAATLASAAGSYTYLGHILDTQRNVALVKVDLYLDGGSGACQTYVIPWNATDGGGSANWQECYPTHSRDDVENVAVDVHKGTGDRVEIRVRRKAVNAGSATAFQALIYLTAHDDFTEAQATGTGATVGNMFDPSAVPTNQPIVSKTSTYTVLPSDATVLVDATSGAVTVNLPVAAKSTGRILRVKKTDSSGNAVTLDGNASETIDGATTLALATQYSATVIQCDGTGWQVVSNRGAASALASTDIDTSAELAAILGDETGTSGGFVRATGSTLGTTALAPGANASALTSSSSYSLTGSNTSSLIDMSGTWNTSGAPTLVKFNVTDTTSDLASLVFDFQTGGTSRASLSKLGALTINGAAGQQGILDLIGPSGGIVRVAQSTTIGGGYLGVGFSTPKLGFTRSGDYFLWYSTATGDIVLNNTFGGTSEVQIAYGGTAAMHLMSTSVWEQRSTTVAQISRIYRTYTDTSNYERQAFQSAAGRFDWAAETAGTGTDDIDLRITPAGTGNVVVNGPLNLVATTELTIASDAITVTKSFHRIDTQSDAASDDLSTISGGTAGDVLILTAENGARDVVVKDGVGNIQTVGDMTLDNVQDTITLIFDGTNWLETARSNNGA